MRKLFLKMKKNIVMVYKTTKTMLKDPAAFFCGPSSVKDLRPLTDLLTIESYMNPLGRTPEISVFDGADRYKLVGEVDALGEKTAIEWSSGGNAWQSIVESGGEKHLQQGVIAAMQAASKTLYLDIAAQYEADLKEGNLMEGEEPPPGQTVHEA